MHHINVSYSYNNLNFFISAKKFKPLHYDLLREIQFACNTMQKKLR